MLWLTIFDAVNKIMSQVDKNNDGVIDFEEFVLAVWNFCTVEGDDFVRFTFNLYDLDGGGTIDALPGSTRIETIVARL